MRIFDIKRFALHDGPGIRTTIFMKGCPLHCVWCHNPEGMSPEPTRLFTEKKCIHCGLHEQGGAEACPTLALQIAGKDWALDDIICVVEKERKVMEDSGGGVSICGGEPLMHPMELKELLVELGKRGFHRAVDTTLYASWQTIESIIPHTDLFLVDIKHMDSALHERYTGVPNEPILSNIRRLIERSVATGTFDIHFRLPLIDGINADDANLHATARFLQSAIVSQQSAIVNKQQLVVNQQSAIVSKQQSVANFQFSIFNFQFSILKYHDSAKAKHARMGTIYNPDGLPMSTPSAELLDHAKDIFAQYDIPVTIS